MSMFYESKDIKKILVVIWILYIYESYVWGCTEFKILLGFN